MKKMGYNGKYAGNAKRNVVTVNKKPISKKALARRKARIRRKRARMLFAAFKWFIARLALGIGLIVCLSGFCAIAFGFLVIMINPENIIGYVASAVGFGYTIIIMNCRIYEYVGDRMHIKWF